MSCTRKVWAHFPILSVVQVAREVVKATPKRTNPAIAGVTVLAAGIWAVLAGLLGLGLLFPWEAPGTRGEAVLRVIGSEGETYTVVWGPFVSTEPGRIEEGSSYRDHKIPPEAGDSSGGYNVVVRDDASGEEKAERDGNIRAILFTSGRYATCARALGSAIRLYWYPEQGLGDWTDRALCGSYRYSRLLWG
jgi:hypothetical protein